MAPFLLVINGFHGAQLSACPPTNNPSHKHKHKPQVSLTIMTQGTASTPQPSQTGQVVLNKKTSTTSLRDRSMRTSPSPSLSSSSSSSTSSSSPSSASAYSSASRQTRPSSTSGWVFDQDYWRGPQIRRPISTKGPIVVVIRHAEALWYASCLHDHTDVLKLIPHLQQYYTTYLQITKEGKSDSRSVFDTGRLQTGSWHPDYASGPYQESSRARRSCQGYQLPTRPDTRDSLHCFPVLASGRNHNLT
jgi:hypothetical protein